MHLADDGRSRRGCEAALQTAFGNAAFGHAESEERVREHSRLAGFPITRVNETVIVIDPLTTYS